MRRLAEDYLHEWRNRPGRKPLIIRGARQVGKTHLVVHWSRSSFESLVSVDLERERDLHPLFDRSDPQDLLHELGLLKRTPLIAGRTLLFLDEIQACPAAIRSLRYFHELVPELHVVAAGSLLDVALREFPHAVPVGRVEYLYLQPLSFDEFVRAMAGDALAEKLGQLHVGEAISPALDQCFKTWLRQYVFVGGMPEAVQAFTEHASLVDIQRIQSAIVETMEHDFAKYGTRAQQELLRKTYRHVARNVGRKITYVNISNDTRAADVRAAFDLLTRSRTVHPVFHSSANGVPLGAEVDEKRFKGVFLDAGLANQVCGLSIMPVEHVLTVNEGALAEQLVGQELVASGPSFQDTPLFYWHREARTANAEVDYVMSAGADVLPVEVKSARGGALRSLFQFLVEKRRTRAIRLYLGPAAVESVPVPGRASEPMQLLSLPLYMAGQIRRLAAEWTASA